MHGNLVMDYEPSLNDIVETSYTKITNIQGSVVEMRILKNGTHVFQVQHLDGFRNWYFKHELVKVGMFNGEPK